MKLATTVALVLLLIAGQHVSAETPAVSTLAGILLNMQHFPSDQQKAAAESIAADEQVDEDMRIIAGAIANIEHLVPDAERAALQGILDDPSSSEAARTLASAAMGFEHQLSPDGKAALQALIE